MTDFPWGSLITGLCTLFGVGLAFGLNNKRARVDRLWELRRAAYGTIISLMRRVELALVAKLSAPSSDIVPSRLLYEPDKTVPPIEERIASLMAAHAEVALVLSPAFAKACDHTISLLDRFNPAAPPEYRQQLCSIVEQARVRLTDVARQELEMAEAP